MAQDLAAVGAQALAMPCNAAQAYARQIISATALPFLDMRTASVAHLRIACTEHSLLAIAVQDLAWTDTLDCLTGTIAAFAKCT